MSDELDRMIREAERRTHADRRAVGHLLQRGEMAFHPHHVTMRQEPAVRRSAPCLDIAGAPSAYPIDGRHGSERFAEPSPLYRARKASHVVRRRPKRMKRKRSLAARFFAWVFGALGSFQPYGRTRVVRTPTSRTL